MIYEVVRTFRQPLDPKERRDIIICRYEEEGAAQAYCNRRDTWLYAHRVIVRQGGK